MPRLNDEPAIVGEDLPDGLQRCDNVFIQQSEVTDRDIERPFRDWR
ncbi:MAG: hypothetical protein ACI9DC_001489 [Gammaproteobacteria bacterium]|jgi:hypothetical protein